MTYSVGSRMGNEARRNDRKQMTMNKEDRHTTYQPDAIPASITRTLYVGYGIGQFNAGNIVVSEYEHDTESLATVRIMEKDITFNLPPSKVDVKGKMLEVLEAEKQKILAENHQRLHKVQEKIDRLLAIEYQQSDKGA